MKYLILNETTLLWLCYAMFVIGLLWESVVSYFPEAQASRLRFISCIVVLGILFSLSKGTAE